VSTTFDRILLSIGQPRADAGTLSPQALKALEIAFIPLLDSFSLTFPLRNKNTELCFFTSNLEFV